MQSNSFLAFSIAFLLLTISTFAQEQEVLWYDYQSASGIEIPYGIDLDAAGNIIMVGTYSSVSLTFGDVILQNNGLNDLFIVKYNSEGEVLWAIGAGGDGSETANSVSIDGSNNIYVVGAFSSNTFSIGEIELVNSSDTNSDMFVAKISSDGIVEWALAVLGTDEDVALAVAAEPSGEFVISGYFRSLELNIQNITLENSSTSSDAFVAKFDSNGNIQWAESFGGIDIEAATSIAIAPDGTITACGYFKSSFIDIDSFNLQNQNPGWSSDIFIATYDTNGTVNMAKRFGGTGEDIATDISIDSNGNIVMVGGFRSEFIAFDNEILASEPPAYDDVYVIRMDAASNVLWAKSHGSMNLDVVYGVSTNSNGDILMSGGFSGPEITFGTETLISQGDQDMFLLQYNSAGDVIWSNSFGGIYMDFFTAVEFGNNGTLVVAGSFLSDEIVVDGNSLSIGGYADYLIIKTQYAEVGIDNIILKKHSLIYPNPSEGTLNIKGDDIQEIAIYAITGELVLLSTNILSPIIEQIDLSSLSAGTYTILWKDGQFWNRDLLVLN